MIKALPGVQTQDLALELHVLGIQVHRLMPSDLRLHRLISVIPRYALAEVGPAAPRQAQG